MVEEIAVVGHHQQRQRGAGQIALKPYDHLKIEMVGRLIKNQEIGLVEQGVGQRHPLLLSTAELPHGLAEIRDVQLCEDLLGSENLVGIALVIEASVEHALLSVELRCLFQDSDADVVAIDDLSVVVAFFSC